MAIVFKTRPLYSDEIRVLKTLKTQKEKRGKSGLKFYHILLAALVGAGFTYLAVLAGDSFWAFLLGTIAVFSFGVVVFGPYEIYKFKKKHKRFLQQLSGLLDKGTVDTCVIHAKRIAVAKEYEDEGDLFIIEYDTDQVLYLWDHDYNLRKPFPCLSFEIYEEGFFELFGRQVHPLSLKVQATVIDRKAKWKYFSKVGAPGQLEIQKVNFDKVVEAYRSFG